MLWSNTNKVGCGLTEYKDGKWFAKLYTCDYAPAGNFINGQMYKIGKACSSCPKNMRCSNEYPGLCGKNRKIFLLIVVYGESELLYKFTAFLNLVG